MSGMVEIGPHAEAMPSFSKKDDASNRSIHVPSITRVRCWKRIPKTRTTPATPVTRTALLVGFRWSLAPTKINAGQNVRDGSCPDISRLP